MENKFELLCSDSNKVLKINATRGEEYIVESGKIINSKIIKEDIIKTSISKKIYRG